MKFAESRFPENDNISSSVTSDNNLSLIQQASIWCENFFAFLSKTLKKENCLGSIIATLYLYSCLLSEFAKSNSPL